MDEATAGLRSQNLLWAAADATPVEPTRSIPGVGREGIRTGQDEKFKLNPGYFSIPNQNSSR